MVAEVQMPALSPTMTEGKIVSWNKKEGDSLGVGDVILEVETDKAVMEVEAQTKGTLGKILFDLNETVSVGTTIALILEKGESQNVLVDYQINNQSSKSVADSDTNNQNSCNVSKNSDLEIENVDDKNIKADSGNKSQTFCNNHNDQQKSLCQMQHEFFMDNGKSNDVFASPLAKNIAKINNVNISEIHTGSGPKGRIIKSDVEKFISNNQHSDVAARFGRNINEFTDIEPSAMRRTIANRLTESKQQVPHWYLKIKADMSCFVSFRKKINDMAKTVNGKPEYKVSANDIIIMATAQALRKNPKINTSWADGKIRKYNNIDVAVAVAVEDGIFTPIIKNADKKSLLEISTEMKSLVERAKNGKLLPKEFQGGSITISNLGMYGIQEFCSIINQPQSCILAVGAIEQTVVATENNEIAIKPTCIITLSADHRVIDGATLAIFADDLKKMLESPEIMLV